MNQNQSCWPGTIFNFLSFFLYFNHARPPCLNKRVLQDTAIVHYHLYYDPGGCCVQKNMNISQLSLCALKFSGVKKKQSSILNLLLLPLHRSFEVVTLVTQQQRSVTCNFAK